MVDCRRDGGDEGQCGAEDDVSRFNVEQSQAKVDRGAAAGEGQGRFYAGECGGLFFKGVDMRAEGRDPV